MAMSREERNRKLVDLGHTPELVQGCCFISPEGDCFPVAYEEHYEFATDLLEIMDYFNNGTLLKSDLLDGWMTIHRSGIISERWLYVIEGGGKPSADQAATLLKIATLDRETGLAYDIFRWLGVRP